MTFSDFAKDGFNYRTAYFKDFDGNYYRLKISVGKSGEVNTVYNVGKINEAQSPYGSKTNQQKADRGASASSNDILSEPERIVNTDLSKNVLDTAVSLCYITACVITKETGQKIWRQKKNTI